jgi:hypothetical protein
MTMSSSARSPHHRFGFDDEEEEERHFLKSTKK